MTLFSCLLLGLAMSTDAFAAALARGAGMAFRPRLLDALGIGLIFGVVEALTPVIGWALGSVAAGLIQDYDHWAAFLLLLALGLQMIRKSFQEDEALGTAAGVGAVGDDGLGSTLPPDVASARSKGLLAIAMTGLATSIDAMAVGVGLAFVEVNIAVVASIIGLCTFVMVTLGVMAGRVLGTVVGRRAEMLGGLVLIAVGSSILYSHLSAAGG